MIGGDKKSVRKAALSLLTTLPPLIFQPLSKRSILMRAKPSTWVESMKWTKPPAAVSLAP